MSVSLRTKGRLSRLRGVVLDFNRHGIAIFLDQPVARRGEVMLTIHGTQAAFEHEVVGVVHNCTAYAEGYRCGIQFRTDSARQFDPDAVRSALAQLERSFAA
ncbi:MAG: PilZ domain-containing protein [Pseudomonadales bacterium]|nr:PilZ domain-containing protein [Pseudomonadales bacterium]MCP5185177.1 PilZ domain-containing protein [Pseudomonadales bacterium]